VIFTLNVGGGKARPSWILPLDTPWYNPSISAAPQLTMSVSSIQGYTTFQFSLSHSSGFVFCEQCLGGCQTGMCFSHCELWRVWEVGGCWGGSGSRAWSCRTWKLLNPSRIPRSSIWWLNSYKTTQARQLFSWQSSINDITLNLIQYSQLTQPFNIQVFYTVI